MEIKKHPLGVITVDNFLSSEDCIALIEQAEVYGFEKSSIKVEIRNNQRAVIEDPVFVNSLWDKLKVLPIPKIQNLSMVGLPKTVRFYKYQVGQKFKMHKDGGSCEGDLTSQLTFMIYLNADFIGGETDFREFKVIPKTGMAVLFPHKTFHEGCMVKSGIKYAVRTDVFFK